MNRLAITSLEVTAAGYAVCAFLTYMFWWSKLQDLEVPVTLDCRDYTTEKFRQLLYPESEEHPVKMGWLGLGNVCGRLVRTLRTQNGIRRRKQSDNWRSANKVKDQPRASWERDKRVECARLVTLGV